MQFLHNQVLGNRNITALDSWNPLRLKASC
jgi:hypothetical protein